MKILHLTLKKKWFDMINSGVKKEEYREIKPYWKKRLFDENGNFKNYDYIIFKNGYSKNAHSIKVNFMGVTIGNALPEWSDNWQGEVFIIKLGNILNL